MFQLRSKWCCWKKTQKFEINWVKERREEMWSRDTSDRHPCAHARTSGLTGIGRIQRQLEGFKLGGMEYELRKLEDLFAAGFICTRKNEQLKTLICASTVFSFRDWALRWSWYFISFFTVEEEYTRRRAEVCGTHGWTTVLQVFGALNSQRSLSFVVNFFFITCFYRLFKISKAAPVLKQPLFCAFAAQLGISEPQKPITTGISLNSEPDWRDNARVGISSTIAFADSTSSDFSHAPSSYFDYSQPSHNHYDAPVESSLVYSGSVSTYAPRFTMHPLLHFILPLTTPPQNLTF